MAKASWEQDLENEEQYQQSLIAEKRAGYARMSPRKAVVAELKNVLPGKLHVRHMYARNKPAQLNWKQEKVLQQMKAFNKTLKGHKAVANVIAGRRLNKQVPAGQPNLESVKSLRGVSRRGLGLNPNVENVVAQMLHGPRRTGQLPVMTRMGLTRRGKNIEKRMEKLMATRRGLARLGPGRNRVSKARSASARLRGATKRSKSKATPRSA